MTWLRVRPGMAGPLPALHHPYPYLYLTRWPATGLYTLTSPRGTIKTDLTADAVRAWCAELGIAAPTDEDLEWMAS